MPGTESLANALGRLGVYALIAVVLVAPLVPFWYVDSTVGRGPSLVQIGGALLAGSLILLCGLVVLERYAGTRPKAIASFNGFCLGLNAGLLCGEWSGLSQNASVFPGLAGALVWSLGILEMYERVR
ncbi:hypothetical protein [Haloferax massiliensis]|uniref:Uncharacterized protein n=1 Tax=Haloferax massiliensis TaxID=1476858 RepID=A0A0D6JLI1_9EURY|nr:hypothetical protein [Haloferax massiliensis]CQR48756.1 hypothetical protein BN996_00204 [Haloferax massiliensis]